MVNKELRIHNLPREWTSCYQIKYSSERNAVYLLSVMKFCPPYRVGTKQTVCMSGVTILHACTPSLHLGAGSIWHDGLGAGQALWHTARSFQFNVSSSSPPERARAGSSEGLSLGRLPGRLGSELTAPPPRNKQSAGELEVRVKAFVFYSMERDRHGLSWACLHEHMCTSSFYVNLEKLNY